MSHFAAALPHRGSAVWIDEVLSVGDKCGQCLVRYNPLAMYARDGALMETCAVEWIAQSFGFIKAAQARSQVELKQPSQAFLAAIKSFEVLKIVKSLRVGDEFVIDVRETHALGSLILVEGKVVFQSTIIATAQLKVFAAAGE